MRPHSIPTGGRGGTPFSLAALVLLGLVTQLQGRAEEPERLYYGLQIQGVLCGFKEVVCETTLDGQGRRVLRLESRMSTKAKLLGAGVDFAMRSRFDLQPTTGEMLTHANEINMGNSTIAVQMERQGDFIRLTAKPPAKVQSIPVGSDVRFDNTQYYPFVVRDFVGEGLRSKRFQFFDPKDARVHPVTFTRERVEELDCAGQKHPALVLACKDHLTGQRATWWLHRRTGHLLRLETLDRVLSLASRDVVDAVKRANLDESIFAKVGIQIRNPGEINRLKVRASVRVVGEPVTVASLNVPGQTFRGRVIDNLIEGIFEVQRRQYTGAGAPVFPCDYRHEQALEEHLKPGWRIESDEAALVAEARAVTRGAKDCWEAVCRLSRWMEQHIEGKLEGLSALTTYEKKAGDCGGHAFLLVAFCRAVGIPARTANGCTYSPYLGGSFGQHMWAEVYMGHAGWVSIDPILREVGNVDAGHVRLGQSVSFSPQKMEVLNYQLEPRRSD